MTSARHLSGYPLADGIPPKRNILTYFFNQAATLGSLSHGVMECNRDTAVLLLTWTNLFASIPVGMLFFLSLCFAFLGFVCATLVSGQDASYRVKRDSKFILIDEFTEPFNV